MEVDKLPRRLPSADLTLNYLTTPVCYRLKDALEDVPMYGIAEVFIVVDRYLPIFLPIVIMTRVAFIFKYLDLKTHVHVIIVLIIDEIYCVMLCT